MKTFKALIIFLILCTISSVSFCYEANSSLPSTAEKNFLKDLEKWERFKTEPNDALEGLRWHLRSRHFVFGMPRLVDDRHNFKPDGFEKKQPGISILVREGFVIAHFDRMKSPLWVAQRWTRYDFARMSWIPSIEDRPWCEDLDLPEYARGGTSYNGNKTKLDRGHMARHAMNRGWGIDNSNWGCKMSNSVPQHMQINRLDSTWQKLEDEIRDIVSDPQSGIEAVWTISGTIYRDKSNAPGETPEKDFQNVVRLPKGKIGVPDATYKIICWFDENHRFQGQAYVFEQPHTADESGGELALNFTLGNTKASLTTYLVKIDEIEDRTGLDFFPMLQDDIEKLIEGTQYENLWGTE